LADEASGISEDWVKAEAGVKYAFIAELRPERSVPNGFIVDRDQILPTGQEIWAAVEVLADQVLREYTR